MYVGVIYAYICMACQQHDICQFVQNLISLRPSCTRELKLDVFHYHQLPTLFNCWTQASLIACNFIRSCQAVLLITPSNLQTSVAMSLAANMALPLQLASPLGCVFYLITSRLIRSFRETPFFHIPTKPFSRKTHISFCTFAHTPVCDIVGTIMAS